MKTENESGSGGNEPSAWEILETTTHAECRVFSVARKRCRHPGRKSEADFFSIRTRDFVNVLALTPERELVLVNQFRFGVEDFSLEIPGGLVDPGEDALTAGVRELEEETGFTGKNARVIGKVWANPAIMDNVCSFVLVEEAVLTNPARWDEHEEIGVSLAPVEEVMAWARSGKIRHSLVLNALFFLRELGAGEF